MKEWYEEEKKRDLMMRMLLHFDQINRFSSISTSIYQRLHCFLRMKCTKFVYLLPRALLVVFFLFFSHLVFMSHTYIECVYMLLASFYFLLWNLTYKGEKKMIERAKDLIL